MTHLLLHVVVKPILTMVSTKFSKTVASALLFGATSVPSTYAFTTTIPFAARTPLPSTTRSEPKKTTVTEVKRSGMTLNAIVDPYFLGTELLAYSDDPLGDQLSGVNGAVVAGIVGAVIAVGIGFTALLPKVGSAKFALTEEEESAVQRVELGYDSKAWEQELTEEGTKGYVNRKRQAGEAKEAYQIGKIAKDVKNRSLRYSETNLGFIACLIRAAQPNAGDLFVDLGSGAGRSTLAAATVFPSFKKCIGVEFLQPLTKLSNGYKGKVKGRKANIEFVTADFAEYDLSSTDIVFASASYFNNGDLEKALETLSSGAKVLITDKRLGSGFKLVTQVDDPSGDLVLNTGYVFEKL